MTTTTRGVVISCTWISGSLARLARSTGGA
jgi:hypothetical protein